ncbi:MAG: hypothetical protein IPM81_20565 [Saprospirales bacterium]|nr:hypothetical protein [Saprospirales bacterium]
MRLLSVSGSCLLLLLFSGLRLHGQGCNNLSQIALDENCSVEITPDMVLEGTPADSNYVVQLTTPTGTPAGTVLSALHLGQTFLATVTDTTTGNSCWGMLVVEDHLPPVLQCTDLLLPCALPDVAPAYLSLLGIAGAVPVVTENCAAYELTFTDTWTTLACDDPQDRSASILRIWTAVDASGNQTSCSQYLQIRRTHVQDVLFPADTTLNCADNPLTIPTSTGEPYASAYGRKFPLYTGSNSCALDIVYQDQILPLCPGAYKILRTWTIYDDCLPTSNTPPGTNPLQYIQVIKVLDTQAPLFQCPADTVVSTDPFYCHRNFDLPDVALRDACSGIAAIRADWKVGGIPRALTGWLSDFPGNNHWTPDTLGALGVAENLPAGIFPIQYTVTDGCGNSSTCTFILTVSDGVVPWAVCDEYTQVALGITGAALVQATTFDDGSGDNCSPVQFKVRRVETNPCQPNDRFLDAVKFCCADVGDTVAVILRVFDLPVDTGAISLTEKENHASDCLVRVFVEDKIKPVCQAPFNATVSCLNFDPGLSSYGTPVYADNCCLDTFFELPPNYSLFDTLCNRGTITRAFRAFDCYGLSSQCTQRLVVTYDQNYWVKFPDDVFVSDCDTTGVYSPGPQVFGEDCETIAISYQDNVSTGGILSCYWIERRWMVVDCSTYNPNLPLIDVPNPNPAPDPLDAQNTPGPIVAPPGNSPPATQMRITPLDPHPTDYSKFWAANANGYLYRQIISVRDNQPPKIRGCPFISQPVQFCDHTDNDPLFWNEWYWQNPFIANSHDLCENRADLAVTASDGCSKGNVNIRYLLFLDLDGDGTQETVVNSINPPPPNTVFFGNALTPNFTGGTPRAFDERPVPQEEKYFFTIQKGGFVNVTGYVRWATLNNPNQYVSPQLPHGVHRIMWVIDDGCGNETICEYPIQIRDCHVPDLVCLNGLSVDIPAEKSITLFANDFLWYVNDNCTPANQIKIGLRKSGAGTAFPFNPDGSPQQSVTFTCDELGTQPVELWASDAAGNLNVCETYVIVQDNFGICPNTQATVAGWVSTESGVGLEDAGVELDGDTPAVPSNGIFDWSDQDGLFRFNNALPFGTNLTLTPTKDNDPLNGVSTFDLVLINKHILGQALLDSPFKIIAADANGSRTLSTFDIVELRKLILGLQTELPNNNSWRFVDKAYVFPDPENPFQEIFPETRQIANLNSSMLQENFIAVKIGDVNGNAVTSTLQDGSDRSAGTALFQVNSTAGDRVGPGQQFSVSVTPDEDLHGCQFTLVYPGLDLLALEPGPNMTPDNFAVFPEPGALTMSWNGDGIPSFTLQLRARQGGQLSHLLRVSGRITAAEAYRRNGTPGETLDIALRFPGENGETIAGQAFELYPNLPNPWHDNTRVRCFMPEAGVATLTLFDPSGKILHQQSQSLEKGFQSIPVQAALPGVTGVMYYRIDTDSDSAVGKMMRF